MSTPSIPPRLWDGYPTDHHPTAPPTWLGNAGGLSGSDLWRCEAPAGPLALRAWPGGGPDPARLDQIHAWLGRLVDLPYVAVPIAGREGRTWLAADGRPWELARWRPGAADLGRPPRREHLGEMFRALAVLHEALRGSPIRGPSPGLIARRDELARLLAGEFEAMAASVARSAADPCRPLAERWLELARVSAPAVVKLLSAASERPFFLQPCLRDVRPDHFLFTGDELTGVVDFGAMGVDTVATDLARLLGETVAGDHLLIREARQAYFAVRPPRREEVGALPDFEAANAVLGGARWVRWHFVEHRRFHGPDAAARGLARTLARLEAWSSRSG